MQITYLQYERFLRSLSIISRSVFLSGENIKIEEKLEGFRERCGLIQRFPKKSNKYGRKIYAMVDARMFFIYNVEIYAAPQPNSNFSMRNKSLDVVKILTTPIYNTGRKSHRQFVFKVSFRFWMIQILRYLALKTHSFALKENKTQIPDKKAGNKYESVRFQKIYDSSFLDTKT